MEKKFEQITKGSVYLDTSVYIYFFEDNKIFADRVDALFERIIKLKLPILASVLIKAELLVKPLQKKNVSLVDKYSNLTSYFPNLNLVDVNSMVAVRAAELRAEFGIGMADAIHLASAILSGAKTFVTADKKLKGVGGIDVIVL